MISRIRRKNRLGERKIAPLHLIVSKGCCRNLRRLTRLYFNTLVVATLLATTHERHVLRQVRYAFVLVNDVGTHGKVIDLHIAIGTWRNRTPIQGLPTLAVRRTLRGKLISSIYWHTILEDDLYTSIRLLRAIVGILPNLERVRPVIE